MKRPALWRESSKLDEGLYSEIYGDTVSNTPGIRDKDLVFLAKSKRSAHRASDVIGISSTTIAAIGSHEHSCT